jgi:signal transduction histidine kinase
MDENAGGRARPLSGISLQQKLPLVMGLLILLVVVIGVLGSYLQVRRAAMDATEARVTTVDQWLRDVLGAQASNRVTQLDAFGDTTSVLRGAVTGVASDSAAVAELLDWIRPRPDSLLPVELWSAQGVRVASIGPLDLLSGRAPPIETTFAEVTPRFGPMFTRDSSVYYEIFIPIKAGERPVGVVRQTRKFASNPGASSIEGALQVGKIYLSNRQGDVWVTVRGELTEPQPMPAFGTTERGSRGDVPVLRHADTIKGTPWVTVIETPLASTLAMPNRFLGRGAIVGLILGAVGIMLAWLLSRRVTSPLGELDAAAAAVAHGAYDKRVSIRRGDELGRLGATFNLMASRVQEAHEELAVRYAEAQSLAAQLEVSNEQLLEAVDVADDARLHAQEANRTKSEFLATMSHEIRTPINAMIGYRDLLEMGVPGELTDQQSRFVARIRESGRHLVALVDELLDFAKIESNEMRVENDSYSTRAAADAAVSALLSAAHRKGVTLSLECTGSYAFRGDSRRVHQIMLNLINNAIKFTEAGGSVSVRCGMATPPVDSMEADEAVYLEVADTGIGIPAEHLERIFEPFVQVVGGYTRQYGGSGLGLAISQKLAHLMGGVVTVTSAAGAGATFTLWLLPAADHVPA